MSLFSFLSVFSKADPLKVGDKAPVVSGVTETGAEVFTASPAGLFRPA